MRLFAGLDVSLETTAICVIDQDGKIVQEAVASTDAEAIADVLERYRADLERVGLEAAPMSEWLMRGLKMRGHQAVQMETRQVHLALASAVKTDRKDARGIANLLRMGWFKPVHVKTASARERRVLLAARDCLVRRLKDLDNSVRGLLRCFGLRPPRALRGRWSAVVGELIKGHRTLTDAISPILAARDGIAEQLDRIDRRVRDEAKNDEVCRRLMTVPGVGAIVALTYVAAIDCPERFRSSKTVGACLGLTPRRYQSGETDRAGAITKMGDPAARVALFEAAHVIMTRVQRWFPLKAWAMRVAARRGAKRAKVALARKLAVILHRIWIAGTEFQSRPASA